MRPSRLFCLVAIGVAIAGTSCGRGRPVTLGETQIGQGKLYQSGSVTYDRFFQDTHAVQLEAMRADEDEAAARAPLERALDARGASLDKLYELAVSRAKKAGDDGPPIVYVTVTGLEPAKENKEIKEPEGGDGAKEGAKEGAKAAGHEPKEAPKKVVVSVLPLETMPPDQKAFVKALTETARGEADILDRFGPVMTKAAHLSAVSDELADGVDREFSARKLRKDVSQELGAAKLILGATEERAREASNRARAFLKGLSEALKPPSSEAPPPPPAAPTAAPEKPAATKPARPRRGGAKPAKPEGAEPAPAAPRPSAPPAKPKKPAEDFNP